MYSGWTLSLHCKILFLCSSSISQLKVKAEKRPNYGFQNMAPEEATVNGTFNSRAPGGMSGSSMIMVRFPTMVGFPTTGWISNP